MVFIMKVITFFIIYLYNVFFINYSVNLLEVRNRIMIKIFPVFISTISMILIYKKIYIPFLYLIILIFQIVIYKIIFYDSIETIYCILVYQIFCIIMGEDIAISILSILLGKSLYQVMQSYELYILSFALAGILTIIVELNFDKICNLNMSKKLLINRKNLKMIILTSTSIVIILLNANTTYYYASDIMSLTYLLLLNRICLIFCFYFVLNTGIKYVSWIEEEVLYKTNILNLEHNYEMKKKIDEYSKLLRMYNHDFKNILFNIKDSIEIGDNKKAIKIIDEFDEKIKGIANYNKTLSNNSLINALLNRVYDKCKSENIFFDSDCYIPSNISISELELIKIFNNLSSNALEACAKQEKDEERWISFKSYVKNNYLIIYQSNSFDGHIKFRNDKLITTKKNKKLHGIGVESIKHIVTSVNGIALVKVEKEKKEFKFLIKMPLKP